ncbi:hypothetical protein HN858_05605 [Candidatus Falkowbacteria bacterium]|jgi:hypothetical protein|nr:hypothetical protein [Candidatus Falkowbacteria bacterium]MBT5502900.1 hypothetical protein [Candidatus Falkowbacteria bacterium]MBT6573736.1 hypothetical protein [Candidatus Falkowbacteria bacterium]MBT7349112.1 hypothetical protein [Candidatus Falkowbacteria bacterium]MBT7500063.1 hypothetical protein [Candidatus Falkowbacteria bacterium]
MEPNHDITIEELYIPSKHEKNTYLCEDFIIYPEGKEKNGGYLMGIIEIRATNIDESEKIVQTIINNLKEHYYNQINSSPEPHKLNLETVFEHALQKTNAALVEMIQIGHINLVLENLHYVIAVAKPNQVKKEIDFVFAHQGLIQVYLLHKTKQNNYKVLNIVDNTPRIKEEQSDKLKIFSSTINGKIFHHNALYLCSEIFSNYIPAHKVNKILSSNDLSTAIDYFKNLINNVKNNSHLTYCSLFIKMEEKRSISDQPISQRSINKLIDTKDITEKYLSPNVALNIWGTLGKVIGWVKSKKSKKTLHSPKNEKKMKFGILKYILNVIKIFGSSITKIGKSIVNIFTGKRKPKTEKTGSLTARAGKKLFSLPKFNKALLISIIVLIVIFISGIFWMNHNKQVKADQAAYTTEIQKAKNFINNAQVNLIYKNESKSLELIKQAEQIIQYLPQASTVQKANHTELTRQTENIKNKLLHITTLTPQLITEIKKDDQPVQLASLKKIGQSLYTNNHNNNLYSVNLDNKQTTSLSTSTAGDFNLSLQEDDNLYFITNQNKLIRFNSESNDYNTLSIDWGESTNITAVQLYSKNIYVLDKAKEQIIKWKANGDDFGTSTNWIKDKGDAVLTKATSLTIDGNIYIATEQGQIYKFFTGSKQDFNLTTIEPSLNGITKLYTSLDLDRIYILESNSKRIVVINKEGAFVAQYLFDLLDQNISDFIIEGKTLYLTVGGKLYQAEL